jgi:hypothetical protein
MPVQHSVAVRNARLAAIEATIGASPTLELRTGPPPATTAAADTGVVLATIALPADWYGVPASGQVTLLGTWQDPTADATGTFGHYRIKQGATCHEQGTCGLAGSDLVMDSATVTAGQQVSIVTFTKTEGNA